MYTIERKIFADLAIQDPLFTSLKTDYPDFEVWFERKKEDDVYVVYDEEMLAAVLYLKTETEVDELIKPKMALCKRLKIGTFKVEKEGYGIGRCLIAFAYQEAHKRQVEELYLTVHEKRHNHHKFIAFIEREGFIQVGYKNEERVYIKPLKNE